MSVCLRAARNILLHSGFLDEQLYNDYKKTKFIKKNSTWCRAVRIPKPGAVLGLVLPGSFVLDLEKNIIKPNGPRMEMFQRRTIKLKKKKNSHTNAIVKTR